MGETLREFLLIYKTTIAFLAVAGRHSSRIPVKATPISGIPHSILSSLLLLGKNHFCSLSVPLLCFFLNISILSFCSLHRTSVTDCADFQNHLRSFCFVWAPNPSLVEKTFMMVSPFPFECCLFDQIHGFDFVPYPAISVFK